MKYRSMDPEYVPQIIREYEYWTLAVHDDQVYLGRCYIWLVREGIMQRFSDLTIEELIELQFVTRQLETALHQLWKPEHMNYAWLGNLFQEHLGHGHMHVIPRYKYPRTFNGVEFNDPKWAHNYPTDTRFRPDCTLLHGIRAAIQTALPVTDYW